MKPCRSHLVRKKEPDGTHNISFLELRPLTAPAQKGRHPDAPPAVRIIQHEFNLVSRRGEMNMDVIISADAAACVLRDYDCATKTVTDTADAGGFLNITGFHRLPHYTDVPEINVFLITEADRQQALLRAAAQSKTAALHLKPRIKERQP